MPIPVKITRLPNDPLCLRISIGGDRKLGFYCLYRGTREQTIEAIEKILIVLQNIPEQPIEEDEPIIGKS